MNETLDPFHDHFHNFTKSVVFSYQNKILVHVSPCSLKCVGKTIPGQVK